MDELPEIGEIDPVLPAPDFFDDVDQVAEGSLPPSQAPIPQLPVANIFDCVTGSELKYDDDLCEYDQFLVGLETMNNNVNAAGGEGSEKAESSSQKAAGEDAEEEKQQSPKDLKENSTPTKEDSKPDEDDASVNGSIVSVHTSEPNTPESRASSAGVIRLSLPVPKVSISVNSSAKKKQSADSPQRERSPQRTLRGRAEILNKRETRTKRKLSDDEEYAPDDDDEDEEIKAVRKVNTTRSGRQTRTSTRYGRHDEEEGESDNKAGKNTLRSRRLPRKVPRYGHDDDEEEEEKKKSTEVDEESADSEAMFEPVKKRKRRSRYWTDDDGIIHFDDGSGTVTKLKPVSVSITRLSEAEIAKLLDGHVSNDEDDDDDNPFLLEVCIDNFRSAEEAVKGGAKRIELCSSLSEGGLTPTGGLLTLVKEKFKDIPVFVMIRPRGGDFVYSPEEIEIMARDISCYKQMGADGFVFGLLTKDCRVDVDNCKLLKETAFPLECTYHRAFDKASNPLSALETIISMGFTRILTSGQAATAHAGIPMIKRLVEAAGSRITILAGAGVHERNVGEIVRRTGVTEVHGSASKSVASTMCAPGPSKSHKRGGNKTSAVKMGTTDDSVIKVTDSILVQRIIRSGRKQIK